MSDEKFVEVYRAVNEIQAHLFADVLQQEGIAAFVEGECRQFSLGELPIGWSTAPRIMAPESQRQAARDLLMQIENGELEAPEES